MPRLVIALLVAASASSALAQATGPSEQQVNQINRSIETRQQNLQNSQQNQFENNQLRGEIQRQNSIPPPPPPVVPVR
jgi:hypothetical protein